MYSVVRVAVIDKTLKGVLHAVANINTSKDIVLFDECSNGCIYLVEEESLTKFVNLIKEALDSKSSSNFNIYKAKCNNNERVLIIGKENSLNLLDDERAKSLWS